MPFDTRARFLRFSCLLLAMLAFAGSATAHNLPRGEDVIHAPAFGEGLSFHNAFQTNMILQRDKPIHIWGRAAPGEKVTVSFAGHIADATAEDDGMWRATLPALEASAEPREMTLTGSTASLTLENILVGDVWVLGGQSNMEFPLSKVENGQLEIVSANFPEIRILTIPHLNSKAPQSGFPRLHQWSSWSSRHFRRGDWDVCTPENVKELSAIGYVFARRIHAATQVPIGVINASRGGTTVETWTPETTIRAIDARPAQDLIATWDADIVAWNAEADLAKRIAQHREYVERMTKQGKDIPADRKNPPTDLRLGPIDNPNMPGACYNGMLAPIAGLSVKGAIFHQGYNNCFNGTEGARMYRVVFPEMIRAWRKAFGDPEMPFGILSLCTSGDIQTRKNFTEQMCDVGASIRDAQYQTFLEFFRAGDKNIGFVSTYDLHRRWYHPQLKLPAGERVARWALNSQYGVGQVNWKPPMVEAIEFKDDTVVVTFDTNVGAVDDGSPIEGFAVAGIDRTFHPADANYVETGKDDRGRPQYDRRKLVLTSMMVPNPVAYRYAWARSPMGNLQVDRNSDIPFATHRSDDWSLEEIPLGVLGDTPPEEISRADRNTINKALKLEDIRRQYLEAQRFIDTHKDTMGATGAD